MNHFQASYSSRQQVAVSPERGNWYWKRAGQRMKKKEKKPPLKTHMVTVQVNHSRAANAPGHQTD